MVTSPGTDAMAPRYDFHIHTAFSTCADQEMSLTDLIAGCEKLGFVKIGITDHYYGADKLDRQCAVLEEIRALSTPVEVYFGVEAGFGYKLGRHPLSREEQAEHGFQYAIGTHHSSYIKGEYDLEKIVATHHEYHLKTVQDPSIDVLGHPWRFLKPEFERAGWPWLNSMKPVPESMSRELARAAVENGKAIEINTTSNLTSLKQPESYYREYEEYIALLNEEGVTFSLASDTHQVSELETMLVAWEVAERIGIPDGRIWSPSCAPANAPVK